MLTPCYSITASYKAGFKSAKNRRTKKTPLKTFTVNTGLSNFPS
jgi:hypothetical protein